MVSRTEQVIRYIKHEGKLLSYPFSILLDISISCFEYFQ